MAFADRTRARRSWRGRQLIDRRSLLASIYGESADDLAVQIDRLIADALVPPDDRPRWSETDAWLIAYPDHFGPAGLQAVHKVIDSLAPAINGVHVLPFHPSSSDGGFSVMDYSEVEPRFGVWGDLVAIARDHRLMADAVVNHVSAQGRWFRAHLEGSPDYANFFRIVDDDADLSAVVRPRPGAPVTPFERSDGRTANYWTTFGADQVDLDVRAPEVLVEILRVIVRYVEHGATAVRLDAVAYLWKDPTTASIHLRETHAIVAVIRSVLADLAPRCVLLTETNVPHADNVAYFGSVEQPEAHAVYQFPLAPLVLHAVQTGDVWPLCRWAASLENAVGTTFLNFLASHDGVGVRPAKGWLTDEQIASLAVRCVESGGAVNMAATPSGAEPYELAASWWSLCAVGDPDAADQRVLASYAVALALRGIPLIYAGTFAATKNATGLAERTGASRDLNRRKYPSAGDYLAQCAGAVGVGLREMLYHRAQSPAFHPEAPNAVSSPAPGVVAIERTNAGHSALVVVNLSSTEVAVPVPTKWAGVGGLPAGGRAVVLAAYGQIWATSP